MGVLWIINDLPEYNELITIQHEMNIILMISWMCSEFDIMISETDVRLPYVHSDVVSVPAPLVIRREFTPSVTKAREKNADFEKDLVRYLEHDDTQMEATGVRGEMQKYFFSRSRAIFRLPYFYPIIRSLVSEQF